MEANSPLNSMGIYTMFDRAPLPRIGDLPNGLHTDLKFRIRLYNAVCYIRLGTGTLPMTLTPTNLYLCANTHAREGLFSKQVIVLACRHGFIVRNGPSPRARDRSDHKYHGDML